LTALLENHEFKWCHFRKKSSSAANFFAISPDCFGLLVILKALLLLEYLMYDILGTFSDM